MTGSMDTLGDRMRELHAAGWIEQLSVADSGLSCDGCRCWAAAEDVDVDAVYRFEGDSDPGDESILFAISMPCGHRGTPGGLRRGHRTRRRRRREAIPPSTRLT